MLAIINNTDITDLINQKSYNVNMKAEYEEWKDGNYVKHRVPVRSRISGSFTVALLDAKGMNASEFLELIESAVDNGKLMITLYVNNTVSIKSIDAFYSIKSTKRNELSDGTYMDLFTIDLEEC